VREKKLDIEIDFISEEEQAKLREEMAPVEAHSIPLNKNLMDWKKSKFKIDRSDNLECIFYINYI
jgi:hypothetical protein